MLLGYRRRACHRQVNISPSGPDVLLLGDVLCSTNCLLRVYLWLSPSFFSERHFHTNFAVIGFEQKKKQRISQEKEETNLGNQGSRDHLLLLLLCLVTSMAKTLLPCLCQGDICCLFCPCAVISRRTERGATAKKRSPAEDLARAIQS